MVGSSVGFFEISWLDLINLFVKNIYHPVQATEAQLEEALSQIESLNMQIEEATGGNVTQDLYDHITSMESEMQNIQEQLESANTERYR